MSEPAVSVPHLLVPFAISPSGSAEVIEQGTSQEIVQSVSNLLGTLPGTRLMVPTYGTPDPTFAGLDPVALQLSVRKWEDRASVSVTTVPGNEESITVSVST